MEATFGATSEATLGETLGSNFGATLGGTFGSTLGLTLGETLDANFGQKEILLRKKVFWNSNPGKNDDFHEMRLFSLYIYIGKISNFTTEIQRSKKKLRRPSLEYQDR